MPLSSITEKISVIPGLNAIYFWPSNKPIIQNGESGYFSYTKNISKSKNVDCLLELKRLLNNAGQEYQSIDVPRLYHGLVSRKNSKYDNKRRCTTNTNTKKARPSRKS